MRVLHLVLYSPETTYSTMKALTENWYVRFHPAVTTVYYYYDESITLPAYDASQMVLRLPGMETYLPGILQKTLDAFAFFQHWPYDYIVRSNISSVIDFAKLVPLLNDQLYAGSKVYDLQWLDPPRGIEDPTLFGLLFAHGTCIILQKAMVDLILADANRVDMSLIDDVAIGKFFRDHAGVTPTVLGHQHCVHWFALVYPPNTTVFRHKSISRQADISTMLLTTRYLTADY